MPFELGFGDIGDDVVFEVFGRFEIVAAAVRTLLGPNVVFDERGSRRRLGSKETGMLAMLLETPVIGRTLTLATVAYRPLATLVDVLQLVFELGQLPPQLGVLSMEVRIRGFQLRDSVQKLLSVIHDDRILPEITETGKRKCLTVTTRQPEKARMWREKLVAKQVGQ